MVVDFNHEHRDAAVQALVTYGKGRHPAGLNFGDRLTYAVASLSGEPLLCVGEDFPFTDLPLVLEGETVRNRFPRGAVVGVRIRHTAAYP